MAEPRYTMRLNLTVLDDLGLNLYSSIPAVLAEAVANSWDADSPRVEITIDPPAQRIVVEDWGLGMDLEDVNHKYLEVGYKRREHEPAQTPSGRHVMGRKGIGKLSLFAISDEISVETLKDGRNPEGFVLRTSDIRAAIEAATEYHPDEMDQGAIEFDHVGTRLILRDLKVGPTAATLTHLRSRLARRFSIIGPRWGFEVIVNGKPVSLDDRGYMRSVQYLWTIGQLGEDAAETWPGATRQETLPAVLPSDQGWTMQGWIGTVTNHRQITDEINALPVLAWGKLIEEDLLRSVPEGGLFTKYIVGELRADFVDADDAPDIVTSARQHLKETDDRYEAMVEWLRGALTTIGNSWTDWRREDAVREASQHPAVTEWLDSLEGDSKRSATQLFAKIGALGVDTESDRRELYRYGILAFERLRQRELLSRLDTMAGEDIVNLGQVIGGLDDLEAAQYGQIVRSRLDVLRAFERLVDDDSKERVLQQYLFDHLWLLHPSWERATKDARIETRVGRLFENIDAQLDPEVLHGRIDIAFRTAAAKHIIVELKRFSVRVSVFELADQLNKYVSGVRALIEEAFPDESKDVEAIAVLGSPPTGATLAQVRELLKDVGARYTTYDQLIADSLRDYAEYLDVQRQLSLVNRVLEELGGPAAQ